MQQRLQTSTPLVLMRARQQTAGARGSRPRAPPPLRAAPRSSLRRSRRASGSSQAEVLLSPASAKEAIKGDER
jgi:hypothetical protein